MSKISLKMQTSGLIFLFLFLFIGTALSTSASTGFETLIKSKNSSAVYYLGDDGKRYVFPTSSIFFSWYEGFGSVKELSTEELASYPLGGNAKIRPGTKLIKITTDPKVYAVEPGGTLRWVQTEDIAKSLYGEDWAKKVVDLPDAFFFDYKIGDPISEKKHPEGALVQDGSGNTYLIESGKKRLITNDGFSLNRFSRNFVLNLNQDISYEVLESLNGQEKRLYALNHSKPAIVGDLPAKEEESPEENEEAKEEVSKLSIGSSEALSLVFSNKGEIVEMFSEGEAFKNFSSPGGFWVEDSKTGISTFVSGTMSELTENTLAFDGTVSQLGLVVKATLSNDRGLLKINGDISSTTEKERAVRLGFRLPLNFAGGYWWKNMNEKEVVSGLKRHLNHIPYVDASNVEVSSFPVASMDFEESGFTFAHPIDEPRMLRLDYSSEKGFGIEYDFGLSEHTKNSISGKKAYHADFEFFIYKHDSKYGYRDALATYYSRFQNSFSTRLSADEVGTFAFLKEQSDDEHKKDLEDFGFQYYVVDYRDHNFGNYAEFPKEKGLTPLAYNNPTEYWRSDEHGNPFFGSIKYSGVGANTAKLILQKDFQATAYDEDYQSFRRDLEGLAKNSAMLQLDNFSENYFKNFTPTIRFNDPASSYMLFSMNPSRDLPFESFGDKVFSIRVENASEFDHMGGFMQGYCGLSTSERGDPFDYRNLAFKTFDYPLTFDPEKNAPAMVLGMNYVNYIKDVKSLAHQKNKIVMCELEESRVDWWYAPHIDAFYLPKKRSLDSKEKLPFDDLNYVEAVQLLRTNAYKKPVITKNLARSLDVDPLFGIDYEEFYKISTLYGVWPGVSDIDRNRSSVLVNEYRGLSRVYLPVVKKLQAATWSPLNYSDVRNDHLILERYGHGSLGNLHLVLFNTSEDVQQLNIRVNKQALGISEGKKFVDALTDKEVLSQRSGEEVLLVGEIQGRELLVLEVK